MYPEASNHTDGTQELIMIKPVPLVYAIVLISAALCANANGAAEEKQITLEIAIEVESTPAKIQFTLKNTRAKEVETTRSPRITAASSS
jgi:hypothetical protein